MRTQSNNKMEAFIYSGLQKLFQNRKRYTNYFLYIVKHKWFVLLAMRYLPNYIWKNHKGLWFKLLFLVFIHDLSKLRFSEFFPYANCFYKEDGSDQFKETLKSEYAWNDHQKRNKHHFQYWMCTSDSSQKIQLLPIPMLYLLEMQLDGLAMCKFYTKEWDIHNTYKFHKKNPINPKSLKLLQYLYSNPESIESYIKVV